MNARVFWLEPTGSYQQSLRRYAQGTCSGHMSYHNASIAIGELAAADSHVSYDAEPHADVAADGITRDDVRWPLACTCGYEFAEADSWQVDHNRLYEARGGGRDGERFTLIDAPPGAMWDASWFRHAVGGGMVTGPDGISLVVRVPGNGDWMVDEEASNCTRSQWAPTPSGGKAWSGRTHYCWVRHGDPRTGELHVDKNGDTCSAGAGSIQTGRWHGFLHHSVLSEQG